MQTKHLWVAALMLTCAAPAVLAAPAYAQTSTPGSSSSIMNWSNPGSYPFVGNFDDVCNLYSATLTDEQCRSALDEYEREIGTVIYLQDGDILQVSFTVNGVHQQKTLRVAFGTHVPSDDPMRRAVAYETGRKDGVKLVRPDVCGNWSIMTIPDPEPVPVPPVRETIVITKVVERPFEVCETPGSFSITTPGQFVPGMGHPDDCGCGLHVPALFVGGETLLTESSPICYIVNPTTTE